MTFLVPARGNVSLTWPNLRELEKELEQLWNGVGSACSGAAPQAWAPAMDLVERDTMYELRADLPGMNKEDMELTVKEDIVTLKGERKEAVTEDKPGFRYRERRHGSFERAFRIPGGIDAAKVAAKFENGVLSVTLPKPETSQPKQIEVQIH